MLVVDIQALLEGPVETEGTLESGDPLLEGVAGQLQGPVTVRGVLTTTGEGRHFWRGRMGAAILTECRRCLAPVVVRVDQTVEALFSAEPDAVDDPIAYPIAERATTIDVREAVREELILAAPHFALCRDDCRGLCPRCGADLNEGPCGCRPSAPDPRWEALVALQRHRPNH